MLKKKIKVLRIISTLNPKYGGPGKAIIDSSIALKFNGIDTDILTCDKPNDKFFISNKMFPPGRQNGVLRIYIFQTSLITFSL